MEKRRWKSTGAAFVWQHRYTAFMFVVYALIYLSVFSLYELETEAVLYSAGLCVLITVPVWILQFCFFRKRYLDRRRIADKIQILDECLPQPKTLAEKDYEEMILMLKNKYDERLTEWEKQQQEYLDYYTTWMHQIKTPISVMRMALQTEDTKQNRELQAELFRIEQYVEMVLSYLRLGSDSSDFVFQEYPLDDLIRQAIHKYAAQFVRRRIRLIYEPVGVTVLTDEKWLLFIIEQILSNAVKYTREGEVRITVTGEKVLQIADMGIGIAPEDLPRIFEKGFTGYNGRADKKATGLGLYLCRMAADKLSHRLRVESEVGKGSVFFIDLREEQLELI